MGHKIDCNKNYKIFGANVVTCHLWDASKYFINEAKIKFIINLKLYWQGRKQEREGINLKWHE